MGRAAVLIDGGYLEKVRREHGDAELDLVSLSDEMCRPSERLRTYYFDALPWLGHPPDPRDLERQARKRQYFASLKLLDRFEIREGRVQRHDEPCGAGLRHTRFNQKLVDVKLSVELVRLAWSGHIERAVLITGDSDFVPAVEAAKDAGVIVKLVYSRRGRDWAHDEIIQAADERVQVDEAFFGRYARAA